MAEAVLNALAVGADLPGEFLERLEARALRPGEPAVEQMDAESGGSWNT